MINGQISHASMLHDCWDMGKKYWNSAEELDNMHVLFPLYNMLTSVYTCTNSQNAFESIGLLGGS